MPVGYANTIEKFWSYIPIDDQDENVCSLWRGPVNSNGYGEFHNKLGISAKAPRAVWEQKRGKIPKGMCVCHTCDNPLCVRISNLLLVTNDDNIKDKVAKERAAKVLTNAKVLAIRQLSAEGVSRKIIANAFQIAAQTAGNIIRRRCWTHI
jgi:hypothetical protein